MSQGVVERVDLLGDDAVFDLCSRPGNTASVALADAAPPTRRYRHGDLRRHITVVQHPRGPMPVLLTMLTNACGNDCYYCAFRSGRNYRREAVTPDELAALVDRMYRARLIRGLFLSSGVVGRGDHTMEQIAATGEILRQRYGFAGYLHLKIMPGASDAAVEAVARVADRVSVNLEAPTSAHLARLTGSKDLDHDILRPLRSIQAIVEPSGRHVSRSTQFVVGAAQETDRDILATSTLLYRQLGLSRVYYSPFHPVPETPLDGLPAECPARQIRLYQADALVRDYGFSLGDLGLEAGDELRRDVDPKLAWAEAHAEIYPVEINRAGRAELLRVPGLGPQAVRRILAGRRWGAVRTPADLRRMGVRTARVLPWITINGRQSPRQLPLPAAPGGRDPQTAAPGGEPIASAPMV